MSKMTRLAATIAVAGFAAGTLLSYPAHAEWKPKGPINLMIGFAPGGGVDTLAREIIAELEKRKGWKIIPVNAAGRGGALMARKLKNMPNDGTALGMAITGSFGYGMLASKNPGYGLDDFTYIATATAGQLGIMAKASKGWKTWDDVVNAAKGKTLKFGGMTQQHADVNFLLEQKFGVKFNTVLLRGGRAVLNALNAGDIDIGYGAGIQAKAVRAGDIVNLVSGMSERLKVSPDAPTLKEIGIPYELGNFMIFVAPKGVPADARSSLADAIGAILKDPNTKAYKFITARFSGPLVFTGKQLDEMMAKGVKDAKTLMSVTN